MKKLILCIVISCSFLLFPIHTFSQSCLPNGITFTTQEEIDNFQTDYPDCTEIEGDVDIDGYNVSNLLGLENLTTIGGHLIFEGTSLVSLSGLDNLMSIGNSIEFVDNDLLEDISSLGNITSIEGSLKIGGYNPRWENPLGNPSLCSLYGLHNLNTIGGSLIIISDNDCLTDLSGLDNLTHIGGSLYAGFVSEIMGSCNNPSLVNFHGLENLTYIGSGLNITLCESLTDLSALCNLDTIGWHIHIKNNPLLNSLSGLDNIESSTISGISIHSNPLLQNCAIQSICDYLISPNGQINIDDNAEGCDSQEEVEEACESVSANEVSMFRDITSSPNPFATSISISYELKQPENVYLSIYNHLGQIVYQTQENQAQGIQQLIWNADGYPDGIYYYRLQVGDEVANGKMMKAR